jgi:tellurite methyltransferase
MSQQAARLLLDHMDFLTGLDRALPVLDLACGKGRNTLALAEQGLSLVFADKSVTALAVVEQRLLEAGLSARAWHVDLEQPRVDPLSALSFGAIICFRYLHRPLFPAIRQAVMPGGLLIYQTFTTEQARFGRPSNPDFLLRPGELKAEFQAWELIHSFEGVLQNPGRAVAQIVARKP